MIAPTAANTRFEEYENLEHFEKFSHRRRRPMPSSSSTSAKRGRLRARALKHSSRRVSNQPGGIHRRRRSTPYTGRSNGSLD
jgi:hypothetical protein